MTDANLPAFGRRLNETVVSPAPAHAPGATTGPHVASEPSARPTVDQNAAAPFTSATSALAVRPEIVELRGICLTRMDATAVASLAPERLLIEVERLISDLATERRVQLNSREQRGLATELVDDMLGLGPLEPLLLDDSINDIMVNGPDHTFVERGGKLVQVPVRF